MLYGIVEILDNSINEIVNIIELKLTMSNSLCLYWNTKIILNDEVKHLSSR